MSINQTRDFQTELIELMRRHEIEFDEKHLL